MDDIAFTCPKCGAKLKVSGERRTPTFSCPACGWTNDLKLYRAKRIMGRQPQS